MIKSIIGYPVVGYHHKQAKHDSIHAIKHQKEVFASLMKGFSKTVIGKYYEIHSDILYESFRKNIPLHEYDQLLYYIDKIKEGEKNILWHGGPLYWAKTSGTNKEPKYIPITHDSIVNQKMGPLRAFSYIIKEQQILDIIQGNQILFSDSNIFHQTNGVKTGALSSLMSNDIPTWAKHYILPKQKTNAIEKLDEKLHQLYLDTYKKRISSITAMPVWLLHYAHKIYQDHGKYLKDIYPDLKLLMLSGMDYQPYLPQLRNHFSQETAIFQTYPASEGFMAYQDRAESPAMQFICNMGIFFEFVPLDTLYHKNPIRLPIWEVEKNIEYALIITSNNGLFSYIMGDTVQFEELQPYRFHITGRVSEYISLFGENLRPQHTKLALDLVFQQYPIKIGAYTVMPEMGTQPKHKWYIETDEKNIDIGKYTILLHESIAQVNANYADCIRDSLISLPEIKFIKTGSLSNCLSLMGKGMQSKMKVLWSKETDLPGVS